MATITTLQPTTTPVPEGSNPTNNVPGMSLLSGLYRFTVRYAASGIPVYWIVNLVDGQIEVYTGPEGNAYANRADFRPGQDIPVVIGGRDVARIPAAGILP